MDFVETGEEKNLNTFKTPSACAFSTARSRANETSACSGGSVSHRNRSAPDEQRAKGDSRFRSQPGYFRTEKSLKGIEKLPDGFTHSPVFLIRNLLRTLPGYYLSQAMTRAG